MNTVPRSSGWDSPTDGKAYEMSKALLCRARKIRMRIEPALHQAVRGEMDEIHYSTWISSLPVAVLTKSPRKITLLR